MTPKCKLLKYIDALDFALYELVLFLDTHPTDQKALMAFEDYKKRRKEAIMEYERQYGQYLRMARKTKPDGSWNWIKGPWPWEYEKEEA